MFTFILTFYFGPIKKKLWYLPMALLILLIVNILRLIFIFYIIKDPFPEWFISVNEWYNNRTWSNTRENYYQFYKDWFNVFHRDIFTWIYYDGVIFILWLIWEEKDKQAFLPTESKNIKLTSFTILLESSLPEAHIIQRLNNIHKRKRKIEFPREKVLRRFVQDNQLSR